MSTPPLPPPTPPPPGNPWDREHHPSTVDRLHQDSQRPAASACGDAEVRGASPAAAPVVRDGVDAGKGWPPAEMHHPSPGAGGPGTAPTDASTEDAGGTAQGGTSDALRASHPDPVDRHAAEAATAAGLDTLDLRPGAVLARAADLMAQRGKAVKVYLDDKGQVCAVGAIRLALGSTRGGLEVFTVRQAFAAFAAQEMLCRHLHRLGEVRHPDRGVLDWSDGHTAEHVIARMREAAATVDGA